VAFLLQENVKLVVYLYVNIMRKRAIINVTHVQKNFGRAMTTSINLTKYSQIEFIQVIGGKKVKRRGLRIGDCMVVAFAFPNDDRSYKIFKLHNGMPVIDATFISAQDALNIAELIEQTYKEYMSIWKSYPDADLLGMTQWTVKNGVNLYTIAQEMSKKRLVSESDTKQLFQKHYLMM